MKTSQKGFIVPLLLIIAAILLAGGGAYFYTQTKSENPPVTEIVALPQATSTVPTTSQITPVAQTSNSQTADWKTYTDTAYGYSIKYPGNWFAYPSDLPIGDVHPSRLTISNYSNSYIDAYAQKHGALALPSDYFSLDLHYGGSSQQYGSLPKIDSTQSLDSYVQNLVDVYHYSPATKTEDVTIGGASAVRQTRLDITGIGGNTKPNQISVFIRNGGLVMQMWYGFDSSVTSIVPVAEDIINSFSATVQTSSSPVTSIIGRICGGGAMANGGACPAGYLCAIVTKGPPAEGTCQVATASPMISSIEVVEGLPTGSVYAGQTAEIFGTDLRGVVSVKIGEQNVPIMTGVIADRSLDTDQAFKVPSLPAGVYNVSVTNSSMQTSNVYPVTVVVYSPR